MFIFAVYKWFMVPFFLVDIPIKKALTVFSTTMPYFVSIEL